MTTTGITDTHRALTRRLAELRDLWIVLAVALVARVLYWILITPDYVPQSDAAQYQDLARHILRGEGFSQLFPQLYPHPTAFRPPGYPYLLAGTIRV